MSLLCAYSDSSASSGSEDEGEQLTHGKSVAPIAAALPSADDLFSASSTGPSVLSSTAGGRFTTSSSVDTNKRRAQGELHAQDSKRPKAAEVSKPEPKANKPVKHFAPPQLKRPNVSTEDLGAWNTQKTMQHHDRKSKGES